METFTIIYNVIFVITLTLNISRVISLWETINGFILHRFDYILSTPYVSFPSLMFQVYFWFNHFNII